MIDARTTCAKFVECLKVVDTWSRAHPAHHPIFIQIDVKDLASTESATEYVTKADDEVRSVFGRGRLVTPDDVKGDAATLRDAVTTRGWPTLREARGKVVLYVNDQALFHEAYTHGRKS